MTVDPLSSVWAKSARRDQRTGELLTTHLANTLDAALELARRVGRVAVLDDQFWRWVALAGLLHDAGKVADGFQVMVGNGGGPPVPWQQRHEVASLGFVAGLLADLPADARLLIATGVAGHHRPITGDDDRSLSVLYTDLVDADSFTAHFGPIQPARITALLSWLRERAIAAGLLAVGTGLRPIPFAENAARLFEDVHDHWKRADAAEDDGVRAVLMQGSVTLADHLSSAHGALCTEHPLGDSYPPRLTGRLARRGHQLRPHQLDAAALRGHLLLRAPTGSGKTEAALLWALTQITDLAGRTNGRPRLFYTLPYLASINAMAQRLTTELDSTEIGVSHSRAASFHLARALADACAPTPSDQDEPDTPGDDPERIRAAGKAVSRAAATRLFRELVRVGTPYQLLRGALAGPAHSSILIDAANSVFVLDELHAYDTRRMGLLLAMMRFWERLGGRLAVMSATMPERLADLLDDTLHQPMTRCAPTDPWPVRHRIGVRADHLTAQSTVDDLLAELAADRSVLVVANNVADALRLFERLAPTAERLHGTGSAFLLHSRFRRCDRNLIEDGIRARFGTDAPRSPGLLVATQVVEVSLDVDFDLLHTSGAPLEALLQRFGRVNRVAARPPAPVVVHEPDYRTRRASGPQLFADGVYDSEPTRSAMRIITRADGREVDEAESTRWLDEVYGSDWGRQWHAQVTHHRLEFDNAFLRFADPFDDRSPLADQFDELFDGTEAVLADDLDEYRARLHQAPGPTGRLLAEDLLLPVPFYGTGRLRWDKPAKVPVLDADYDPQHGLRALRGKPAADYRPGEVL